MHFRQFSKTRWAAFRRTRVYKFEKSLLSRDELLFYLASTKLNFARQQNPLRTYTRVCVYYTYVQRNEKARAKGTSFARELFWWKVNTFIFSLFVSPTADVLHERACVFYNKPQITQLNQLVSRLRWASLLTGLFRVLFFWFQRCIHTRRSFRASLAVRSDPTEIDFTINQRNSLNFFLPYVQREKIHAMV